MKDNNEAARAARAEVEETKGALLRAKATHAAARATMQDQLDGGQSDSDEPFLEVLHAVKKAHRDVLWAQAAHAAALATLQECKSGARAA